MIGRGVFGLAWNIVKGASPGAAFVGGLHRAHAVSDPAIHVFKNAWSSAVRDLDKPTFSANSGQRRASDR
jgi:hypothetical protein